MLLADAAQVADGKLFILGGGWSLIGPDPMPTAVAVKLTVDRHELDRTHHWHLVLEDADGQPVYVTDTLQAIEVHGEFHIGQPDGVPEGVPVDFPMAINFPPLPIPAGARYQWRLIINGDTLPGANVAFSTRPSLTA